MAACSSIQPACARHEARLPAEDLLVESQARIENAVAELQRSVDSLPKRVRASLLMTVSEERLDPFTGAHDSNALTPSEVDRQQRLAPDVMTASPVSSVPCGAEAYDHSSLNAPGPDALTRLSLVIAAAASAAAVDGNAPTVGTHTGSITPFPRGGSLRPHPLFGELVVRMHSHLDIVAKEWADHASSNVAQADWQTGLLSRQLASRRVIGAGDPVFPLHPLSTLPTAFDALTAIVLLTDMAIVPVIIGWDVNPTGFLMYMSIVMVVFWTLDMVLNFCTGYIQGICVVQSWGKVIKRYLKQRFALDLSLILLDVVDLSLTASRSQQSGALRVLRFLRFAKITRLIRIGMRVGGSVAQVRFGALISVYVANWFGPFSHIAQHLSLAGILLRLMFFMFGLAHLLGCLWNLCLRSLSPDDESGFKQWIPADSSDVELYLYGVYWSVTTIFSGGSFLPPGLPWELVISTLLVLVGALFVTSLTSSLAATLVEGQHTWIEAKRMISILTGFLEQERIPSIILVAVQSDFADQMALRNARVTEVDVQEPLSCLSVNMKTLLREMRYASQFEGVHTFRLVCGLGPKIIGELCFLASFNLINTYQDIISVGQDMMQAILLDKGLASYSHPDSLEEVDEDGAAPPNITVGNGTWICEIALLLEWKTVGSLESQTPCETLALSVDAFTRVVSHIPAALAVVSSFCHHLHTEIMMLNASSFCLVSGQSVTRTTGTRSESQRSLFPTDLGFGMDVELIVSNMPTIIRHELVSAPVLERLRQRAFSGFFQGQVAAALEMEVRTGKCHLTLDENGEVLRVVKLALLDLQDENGTLCIQVAESAKGTNTDVEIKFGLPGKKIAAGESPTAVAEDLLARRFPAFLPHVEVQGTDSIPVIEHLPSYTYGIPTKYIKIVTHAVLKGVMTIERPLHHKQSSSSLTRFTAARGALATTSVRRLQSGRTRLLRWSSSLSPLPGTAFVLDSSDRTLRVYAWIDQEEHKQRRSTWRTDAPGWKAALSQMSARDFKALSQWRLQSRIVEQDDEVEFLEI